MELDFWTGTEFTGATYDQKSGALDGAARRTHAAPEAHRHGDRRQRHAEAARHPGPEELQGPRRALARIRLPRQWRGRDAIVIGTGNSGHDIAQDLFSNGARVTLVQRSPTLIVNIEPSAQLPYTLYNEGTPLEDCDLITSSMPMQLLRKTHRMLTEQGRQLDRKLIDDLTASASRSTSRTRPAGSSSTCSAAAATTSMSAART